MAAFVCTRTLSHSLGPAVSRFMFLVLLRSPQSTLFDGARFTSVQRLTLIKSIEPCCHHFLVVFLNVSINFILSPLHTRCLLTLCAIECWIGCVCMHTAEIVVIGPIQKYFEFSFEIAKIDIHAASCSSISSSLYIFRWAHCLCHYKCGCAMRDFQHISIRHSAFENNESKFSF